MRAGRLLAVRLATYLTNHVIAHVPSYRIRHAWYGALGLRLGEGASIQMGCYVWFYGPGSVKRLGASIGRGSRINRSCCLDARGGFTIGDNVSVSPEVTIITAQHDWRSDDFGLVERRVTIEDNVWIGTRAVILPGAHIGRGAVVAAGAVVTGAVPPMAVVAGTPARAVAERPAGAAGYALDGSRPLFE